MTKTVAIIMPAYNATATIGQAARSVLAQTYPHWQLVVIADDGLDYETVLTEQGLTDPRFLCLSSGQIRSGASRARNVGLDAIDTPYAAVLDADDRFKPRKLELAVQALEHHGIVSTALDVVNDRHEHQRFVAEGPDRALGPGEHKWVNLSMDTMIVWDRARTDARYDPELPNFTDFDFLLKLYRSVPQSFHLGTPLHDYVKMAVSMSNGQGVTERMIGVKTLLLERLASEYYPLADESGREGIEAFLRVSLEAERQYDALLGQQPGALFEDHLEPMLGASHRSSASPL